MADAAIIDPGPTPRRRKRVRRNFAVVLGLVALAAILLLTVNVTREIRLLASASSDNVQWQLSQTEVEFLEFTKELAMLPVNLRDVRRKFDIFYSRIATVRAASVFADVRTDPEFRAELSEIQRFLNDSVPLVDAGDAVLRAGLPALRGRAENLRPAVRNLSIAGLDLFAVASDTQRAEVARTLIQLAIVLAILIGTLAVAVLYLNRLIAEDKRHADLQAQTASRLNAIIATSLDGVIVSDAHGRIMNFSPAAEAIFGHAAADVVGRELGSVIVPPHLRAAHEAGMERMRQNGAPRMVGKGRVRMEAIRANGEVFPVELSIQSSETMAGEIFIAFLRDISTLVAAEAELVTARDTALANEKLKTDFLATMSHEIRTPLNGLLGNMDLLRDTPLDADQARYLRNMDTSGRLLMRHISDVLDITRYDAGKMSVRAELMNLSVLLQDIVDSQTSMAAANGTALAWGWIGSPHDWIISDHDRLQHVLMNLVGNAVKFTRDGKITLTVQADPDGDRTMLRFAVTDTGPGMEADLAARVFDDFVTGNSAYDRDVGGTGLGLGIARRFVQALDGQIGVDSTPQMGSTFWVRLPVTLAEPPSSPADAQPAADPIRPLRVLVVEDNEINLTVVRDMLEADGHHVTAAEDGQRGVEEASLRRFDLILMDISMPVMDGRAATRAIRQGGGPSARTPIVAVTANAMKEEQMAFIADGMNGILTKPLSKAALADMLATQQGHDHAAGAACLDVAHNAEMRAVLGQDGYATLVVRFAQEVDDQLDWLRQAGEADLPEIAVQSHKIAGSAALFGATALNEQLKWIERAAKSRDRDRVTALVADLEDLWPATRTALTA